MKYQSKKDPNIFATVDFEDEKCATTRLIYTTGDNAGKSFVVSNSTLKRWWKKVVEEKSPIEFTEKEIEQINTPYPEPKEKKYIPKPPAVVEYEENKRKARRKELDFTLPENYEVFADILASENVKIYRVNSGYISFTDKTKLKLLTNGIGVLASNDLGEMLAKEGMTSKPCIEKGTPFRFDVTSKAQFESLLKCLKELYKND